MGRYSDVPTTTFEETGPDGTRRLIRCYRRQLPPPALSPSSGGGPAMPGQQELRHQVTPGDRLDLLSARYTGDTTGFWRIAAANAALDPDELTAPEAVGSLVKVNAPGMVAP